MPIYEYRCSMPQCGYEKSEILPLSDWAEMMMKCPKCGSPMYKIMSSVGLIKIK